MNEQQTKKRTHAPVLILVGFGIAFALMALSMVVTSFSSMGKQARVSATRASIQSIETAIETYKSMTGNYPKSVDELFIPIGNNRPLFIRKEVLCDSWGTPFQIIFDDDTYEIRSAGPDRKIGTKDDLTNFGDGEQESEQTNTLLLVLLGSGVGLVVIEVVVFRRRRLRNRSI